MPDREAEEFERLKTPDRKLDGDMVTFKAIDGALRVCLATHDSWSWTEVGWATRAAHEAARGVNVPKALRQSASCRWSAHIESEWEAYKATVIRAVGLTDGTDEMSRALVTRE